MRKTTLGFGAGLVLVSALMVSSPVYAHCVPLIRQAEAAITTAQGSADPTRLDQAKALVKEAWALKDKGDHDTAAAKAQEALAMVKQ